MAKPDLDDGWLKYAHELDAALAVADFTKVARIVLREVFSQIYGPAKLKRAKLSASEIAARIRLPRQAIHRGIADLVDSGVLARRADGSFSFLKDYQKWTKKGAPRLSPGEAEWCADAGRTALSHKQQSVINPDDTTDVVLSSIEMTPSSIESTRQTSECHLSRVQTVISIDDKIVPPLRTPLVRNENGEAAPAPHASHPTFDQCIEEARKLLGPEVASRIAHNPADLLRAISGQTDCLVAGIRELAARRAPANNPRGLLIHIVQGYGGDPPATPAALTLEERKALNRARDAERDREREAKEAAKRPLKEAVK